MHSPFFCLTLIFSFFLLFSSCTVTATCIRHRRLLHQPLFPYGHSLPPPTSSPSIAKPPFFFNFPPSSPPPPPNDLATFPANISSLMFPHSSRSSSNKSSVSSKFTAILISISVLSAAFVIAIITSFVLIHRHNKRNSNDHERTDSCRLVSPNATPSHAEIDSAMKKTLPSHHSTLSSTSSEFLYQENGAQSSNDYVPINYQWSPELRPLPPLPRQSFTNKNEVGNDEEEEFFSPRGSSSGDKYSPNFIKRSSNSSLPKSPSEELNLIATSLTSNSPNSLANFPAMKRFILLPVEERTLRSSSISSGSSTHNSPSSQISDSSMQIQESSSLKFNDRFVSVKLPSPPPLPQRPRFWDAAKSLLAENVGPSLPVLFQKANSFSESSEAAERRYDESMKPKLKPLHWDKVRASSDRAMVWDQLKSSSFPLNEEMIETLFTVSSSNLNSKDAARRRFIPGSNQENQLVDIKKSQNIAILLRELQITSDEVCEALLEGNADTLGAELLESLIKMAPTKEEERKLKDIKEESLFKLHPAEKFLKAVLDVPFAFKRAEAMLYIASFDSEVEYLKRSFQTLETACEELRNSRTFLKLLEAVLRAGNRMNVGTNRGGACAFKLDTLLKLVDIKGADGKTTLLHFVLQETIRAEEGSHLSDADPNFPIEAEFRKTGLHVISGLSRELTNVKKAAVMDSDVLSNEVSKLAGGVDKIAHVLKLNRELVFDESSRKFSESMNEFLNKAEEEIINVQAQEDVALSMLKELIEYFHGDSAKEEARPIRIFIVVRDFLSILDQVCKDFRNNRTNM